MLIGYVSDERYVAQPDVLLEFRNETGIVATTRSTASGTVLADITDGHYEVILHKAGFGNKITSIDLPSTNPIHFRLLTEGLVGYAWPKCVKSGERSEFRVHSVEEYGLELWRYGCEKEFIKRIGTFDEHGPRATMQITPDGDYTQFGVQFNKHGYYSKILAQSVEAPE